jgi:hypothetical protein
VSGHDSDERPQQLAGEDRRERGGAVAHSASTCSSDKGEPHSLRRRRGRSG